MAQTEKLKKKRTKNKLLCRLTTHACCN